MDAASGSVQRIEGDNLQEKRSRKEQRRDRQQHYEELESRHDAKALERFKRPAYQSVSVAEYLAKKYDITAEVDTIADRRKRNDGKREKERVSETVQDPCPANT